jgi:hypothetical protein
VPLALEQYRQFVETVRHVLDSLQIEGDRDPAPQGTLNVKNRQGEPIQIGLQNLAQMAAADPTSEWERMAGEYLAHLVEPDPYPADKASALQQLRLRLWPPDYLQQTEDPVYREVAPGLVLVLVLDLPKSIAGVRRRDLDTWGMTAEEAWSAAEEHTAKEPVEVVNNPGPDGTTITFLVGDNLYVSSHAV